MATHKQIRQRKTTALTFIFGHVRGIGSPVKLNDMYKSVKYIWKSQGQFIQDALKVVPADINITAKQKGGTFAVATGVPTITVKRAIMGGLFPHQYEGRLTNVVPTADMKQLKKLPKMFESFPETVEVYRAATLNESVRYLQVTKQGNYMFQQV